MTVCVRKVQRVVDREAYDDAARDRLLDAERKVERDLGKAEKGAASRWEDQLSVLLREGGSLD